MGCRPRLLCSTSTVLQPATGQVTFGRIPRRICDLVGARPLSEARAQDDHDASHSCRLQRGGPGGGDLPRLLRTEQPSSRRRSDQQRGVRGVQACGVRRVRRNADTGRSCAVPDVQGTAPTASAAVQHVSKVPSLLCPSSAPAPPQGAGPGGFRWLETPKAKGRATRRAATALGARAGSLQSH